MIERKVYYGKRLDNPSILDSGVEDNYYWIILSIGTHPTAYVGLPEGHQFFGWHYDDFYEKERDIEVHGGLTYSEDHVINLKINRWWIGWDYGHAFDYSDYRNMGIDMSFGGDEGKKWTIEEIKKEVLAVIKQLNGD